MRRYGARCALADCACGRNRLCRGVCLTRRCQRVWLGAATKIRAGRPIRPSMRTLAPDYHCEQGRMSSRGLYRSRRHRLIAGVAGGMAERFGLPVFFVRLIWLLLLVPGGVPGVVPYVICWVLIPSE